ncbi:MAG TPA: transposase, partial [Polyangiaceae bacterium]|nr:transposase [Polyangiaceae bacterium]
MEKEQNNDTAKADQAQPVSNAERAALRQEWIDELVSGCRTEADLFGPNGTFTRLKGAVMERLLDAEMSHHLGYERNQPRKGENARNGHSRKTV